MKTYIGTKMVQAEPATRVVTEDCSTQEGYRVRYEDGYESWSPKAVFERAYLEMDVNPLLRTTKPSISQKMVDDFIIGRQVTTMGNKCTVVRAILRNGFEIVESSACVSVENYDEDMGAEI